MVRYSKKYGDMLENPFTWGLEIALGYLLKLGKNYVYKARDSKALYEELNNASDHQLSPRQVSNMIYQLKNSNYIEICDEEGEKSIKLTNKAKIKLVEKIIEEEPKDNKYRFVSFDIPERLHHRRDKFRRTIKRMGFRQIQQSLWVTDKNIGEMVDIAAQEFEVEEYVAYIVSEKSNIDLHIKKTLHVELS
ncbi:MAG: hypothetical protein WC536_03045 [Patescibacteria group bacterium]